MEDIDRAYEQHQLCEAIGEVYELREEIQQLKDKIDFYEGELVRRGYVIKPEDNK